MIYSSGIHKHNFKQNRCANLFLENNNCQNLLRERFQWQWRHIGWLYEKSKNAKSFKWNKVEVGFHNDGMVFSLLKITEQYLRMVVIVFIVTRGRKLLLLLVLNLCILKQELNTYLYFTTVRPHLQIFMPSSFMHRVLSSHGGWLRQF